MNELVPVIQNFSIQIALDEVEYALQEGVERLLIRSDDADSDLGALQKVLTIDFRDRDLEVIADPALQAAHDHALLLQTPASRQVKIEEGVGNHHG
jgi:hypothetical protein